MDILLKTGAYGADNDLQDLFFFSVVTIQGLGTGASEDSILSGILFTWIIVLW